MLRIRVKMGPPRNKEWTCCFGLHVHTATIMIGLWHLFLNILALCLLAFMIRNPEMMHELDGTCDDCVDLNAPALPTPLSKVEPPYAYRDHSLNYRKSRDMGGLVCFCMIAITLMMIYGAVKGKPSHLLPFFCLQLFDFALTTLTAAGYVCYLQSIHRLIAESHRLPYREKLLQLSPDALVLVVLIAFVSIVFIKAYAIGIVWRCYKYLTMRQHNIRSMLPYIIPHVTSTGCVNGNGNNGQERDYSTLLPDYDEAIAQSMKQQPPPSYQVAMSNIQVELPIETTETNNNNNNAGTSSTPNSQATTTTTTTNNNNNNNNNNTDDMNAAAAATPGNFTRTALDDMADFRAAITVTQSPPPYAGGDVDMGSPCHSIISISSTGSTLIGGVGATGENAAAGPTDPAESLATGANCRQRHNESSA